MLTAESLPPHFSFFTLHFAIFILPLCLCLPPKLPQLRPRQIHSFLVQMNLVSGVFPEHETVLIRNPVINIDEWVTVPTAKRLELFVEHSVYLTSYLRSAI